MLILVGQLRRLVREASEALSPEDEKRDQLISYYSDIYKEKNGIRPRWAYEKLAAMPIEELEAAVDQLASEPGMYDDEILPSEEEFRLEAPPSDDVRDGPVDSYENLPSRSGMGRRR